ncbi:hypothetical protein BC830DRAFT_1219672 [Chytriomyces sp. MP71]|nr:hypothetical protein BC830DRAFT_1219672 [Chytriomyces sp. MP71]
MEQPNSSSANTTVSASRVSITDSIWSRDRSVSLFQRLSSVSSFQEPPMSIATTMTATDSTVHEEQAALGHPEIRKQRPKSADAGSRAKTQPLGTWEKVLNYWEENDRNVFAV